MGSDSPSQPYTGQRFLAGVDEILCQRLHSHTEYAVRSGIPDNRFLFGYVGLMGRAHGATVIIDAATRLKSVEQIHFLIVGDGELREKMEKKIDDLGLAENLHFTGWITETAKMYADIDM